MPTKSRKTAALLIVAHLALCGCPGPSGPPTPPQAGPNDRDADPASPDPLGDTVASIAYLDQNWSSTESLQFYFTSQGSQIVPYAWFLALEQPQSDEPFRVNGHLAKYRFLTQKPGVMNPDGLPIGFVRDDGPERSWLGFTCAACHTGQINYGNIGYRIDGAPSGADIHGFLVDLSASLVATRDDPAKFDRFAAKVGASGQDAGARDALRRDLDLIIKRRRAYLDRNFPSDPLPGFARVDAFGAILNEVYHRAVAAQDGTEPTANTKPANAPVSYPCLWDAPQHDLVQWNGAAENKGLGALGRNVGEVLGVFGDYAFPERPSPLGYASTVQIRNLLKLESWVTTLWSPEWPAAFPAVDRAKAERGRALYTRAGCVECHAVIDRRDPGRKVQAIMRAAVVARRGGGW
jgi:hypothetical protein